MVAVLGNQADARATPATPVSTPVPIDVLPSLNVTVPVGKPAPGLTALTVAVKVTVWPNTEALDDEVTVVVVHAVVTVCWKVSEVLVLKSFVSLTYTAVIVCVPIPLITDAGAPRMATSGLRVFNSPMPIDVAPSRNVTVPVGVPAPGLTALTVAVKVMF